MLHIIIINSGLYFFLYTYIKYLICQTHMYHNPLEYQIQKDG